MAKRTHDFKHQKLAAQNFLSDLQKFKNQLDRRRDVWNRMSPEGRKKWMEISDGDWRDAKDPVINVAMKLYKYLKEWGFDEYDSER